MSRNVEIKARWRDPAALRRRVRELATEGPHEIVQHDTFFHCPHGRLKLRRFGDGSGELIAYRRADAAGPAISDYDLVACADPDALSAALTTALGVLGVVAKHRTLWLVGRTRVHLDEVVGLGSFVELEVVLTEGEPEAAGTAEAETLLLALGIDPAELVEDAYIDLLLRDGASVSGYPAFVYSPRNGPT